MEQKKRGCLGCSFPLLIGIIVVVLAFLGFSFLGGAFGTKFLPGSAPKWLIVNVPAIHLPTNTLFTIGGFAVTNTLLTAWISIVVLVLLSWIATRRVKLVPKGLQNLLEFALEWMLGLCIEVAGEKNGRRFFPVVTTIFLFVIINAWMNLIPGYGTITNTQKLEDLNGVAINSGIVTGHAKVVEDISTITEIHEEEIYLVEYISPELLPVLEEAHDAGVIVKSEVSASIAAAIDKLHIPIVQVPENFEVEDHQLITMDGSNGEIEVFEETHLLRGANTDINFPLALAFIAFIFIWYHGISALGLSYFKKFFAFGRFLGAFVKLAKGKVGAFAADLGMGFIDIFVGVLEFMSEFVRVISFTFRLFGNMLGGEILILMMMFLVPWVLAIPFYGLELFVGLIQAVVFAGLTLVFAAVAATPHEGEGH